MSEVDELKRIAHSLSEAASAGGLDERELVMLFFQEGFFSVLGYGRVGEDIRLEQRTLRGRVDVTLRAFAARPVAVLEFKAPGIPLAGFIDQLSSYTAEVFPEVGILTNGTDLWLFRCENGLLLQPPIEQMMLADLTVSQARGLYECLRLRHVDLRRLDAVNQCLNELRSNPLPVSGPMEAGGVQFLKRFELKENTPFGRLVLKLSEALPGFRQHSDFTKGAYEFWRRIYSRQLDSEETPSSWRPFVQGVGREALYQFMFSLETAYAILSRVMLAKAMQDNRFPYIDILRSFAGALEAQHERGTLQSSTHVDAVASVFREAGMLNQLERSYLQFTTKTFDRELSLDIIPRLLPLFSAGELEGFGSLLDDFVERNREKLEEIFRDYAQDERCNPLLFQPETLLVFERLDKDPFRLKELWATALPVELLESLAAIWGSAV